MHPKADLIARAMPMPVWVEDALVGPLTTPADPEMIGCLAETGGTALTHLRGYPSGRPANRLEVHGVSPGSETATIDAAIYGGPLLLHFGHLVAESIHRLWAAHVPGLDALPVLFQTAPGDAPWRHPWVEPILALCGIARTRVRIVDRPVRVRRLAVPVQGRVLGGREMVPGYAALFPLADPPPVPRMSARRLYVSRAGSQHDGSYLGESLVERLLADAGFAILHPETLPIVDLVASLRAAETIVFAEGSAIHNLELCGPVTARVFVIGRRPGVKLRFGPLLDSLAAHWAAFGAGAADVSLDWDDARDAPREHRGCSMPDLTRLLAALSRFTGIDLPPVDKARIRRAQREDLLRFLMHPATGRASDDRQLGHALRRLRHTPAMIDLLSPD